MQNLIYAFIDNYGRAFYIGKTCDIKRRNKQHLYEVNKGNKLPKYNKLRKLIKEGNKFEDLIIIMEDNISPEEIDEREIFHIKKLREEGYKLKNLTNGGEGGIMSIFGIGEKIRKANLGSKRSEETKKKMSESRLGMKFSEEHKKNLSISRKKRITTQETRDKASKTSKGKINIKNYKLIDSKGNVHITEFGLTKFCEENNLNRPNFFKVLKGERDNVKGWKIERL
jgi:hypothetical protein